MDTDRELPRAAAAAIPHRGTRAHDAVPMLRFLIGSCRAVLALVLFVLEVARADVPDPIGRTPRILRSV